MACCTSETNSEGVRVCAVYWVDYTNPNENQRNHRALFVELHPEEGEGTKFHAVGLQINMKFEEEERIKFDTGLYMEGSKKEVGRLPCSKLERLKDICRSVEVPRSPMKLPKVDGRRVHRPDCVDWVSNVTFELLAKKVITASTGFCPPSSLVPLVIPLE